MNGGHLAPLLARAHNAVHAAGTNEAQIEEAQIEEAVAEHFRKVAGRSDLRSGSVIGPIFQKLVLFLRQLAAKAREVFGAQATAKDILTLAEAYRRAIGAR